MNKNIKVTLNGKTVYGYQGQRILDLCAECGVEIPTLCYDPHLSLHGGCSVCLVEVEGAKTLLRACANTIAPNMVIRTESESAVAARRTALELILSDHVGDCRPPCTLTCPANGNVQAYINLAAQGKYSESLDELHHHVTLPACIGRVCPAPCQEKCRRNFVDEEPVSIREIKRYVGDWGIENDRLGFIPQPDWNGKTVAIVGGGPAGLSAAYYLQLKGYRTTIFEKEQLLGGMMRYGIPDYRLPQDVLQAEIDWLLAHGIEVRTGVALGRDITLDELRTQFDGVILAMGSWKSSPLRVPGEDLEGVLGGIYFLYDVKTNPHTTIGRRVAVVGGGNTAMDACRTARRLGAEEVSVVYRRSREEMPADDIEIEEAMEEGVRFIYLAAPKAIEGDGRVERMVCERMALGEPDASGRRSPVPTGETFVLEVDTVIGAVGQAMDFTGLPEELHDGRKMKVGKDYETPIPGVFTCGDQQTGPKIAIEAIGNGHWAADSMDHYLTCGTPKKPFFYDIVQTDLGPEDFTHIEKIRQERVPHTPAEKRLGEPFTEYSPGLSEEQVLRDAKRCMECACADVFECKLRKFATTHEVHPEKYAGAHISKMEMANEYYVRNMDKCILCGRCVRACDEIAGFHAIDFAKRGFESILTPQFYKDMEHSDCTFCGLCTQVCPVGALIEKRAERWPHLEVPEVVKTTCTLCPLGCELDLNLDRRRTRIVRVTTDLDSPTSPTFGSCCVRGRYDFKNVVHDGDFAPALQGRDGSWHDAAEAFDALASQPGTGYVLGPSLTLEELAALEEYMKQRSPDGLVAATEGSKIRPFLEALKGRSDLKAASYADVDNADAFLLLWTDTDEDQPVLTSWIRRAVLNRGAKVVAIGGAPGRMDKGSAVILHPTKGNEERAANALGVAITTLAKGGAVQLDALLKGTGLTNDDVEKAAKFLASSKNPVALIDPSAPLAAVDAAAAIPGGRYLLLAKHMSTQGVLRRFPDVLSVRELREKNPARLVFVGVTPEGAGYSEEDLRGAEYAVLAPRKTVLAEKAAVVLPTLAWTEKEGSVTNLEGRTLRLNRGVVTQRQGRNITAILAAASILHGGKIPSNPMAG